MPAAQHAFEVQGSRQTLAAGLAEYFAKNSFLVRGPSLSPEAQKFFGSHDVIHVLYGCSTSLPDEVIVKLSSIFGTTGGMSVLRGYRLHESIDIYRKLHIIDMLRTVAAATYLVPRTVLRCLRQHRRWPWTEHESYLSVPLCELRAQFGIQVARRDAASDA